MKTLILMIFFGLACSIVNAQVFKKSQLPSSSSKKVLLPNTPAASKLVVPDNPTISSPVAGSEINGPVVFVGKSQPNAKVTLNVQPIFKVLPGNNGRPALINGSREYVAQNFVIVANAKGIWQSPVIEIKFNTNVTDKKIFAFVAQEVNGAHSGGKNIVYKAKSIPRLISTKREPFIITSPSNNSFVKNNAPVSGKATAGSTIEVTVGSSYFKYNDAGIFKGATQNFTVQSNDRGVWQTDDVNFNVNSGSDIKRQDFEITAVNKTSDGNTTTVNVSNPKNSDAASASFMVTSPKNKQRTEGRSFYVKGKADPGATIEIRITYSGKATTVTQRKLVQFGMGSEEVTNQYYFETKVKANGNGEWSSSLIQNSKKVSVDGGNGKTDVLKQAKSMKIEVRLLGDNGKILKSEFMEVDTMNTVKV